MKSGHLEWVSIKKHEITWRPNETVVGIHTILHCPRILDQLQMEGMCCMCFMVRKRSRAWRWSPHCTVSFDLHCNKQVEWVSFTGCQVVRVRDEETDVSERRGQADKKRVSWHSFLISPVRAMPQIAGSDSKWDQPKQILKVRLVARSTRGPLHSHKAWNIYPSRSERSRGIMVNSWGYSYAWPSHILTKKCKQFILQPRLEITFE